MFDNPLLLMILVLAIAIMGGYFYFKRAQSRTPQNTSPTTTTETPVDMVDDRPAS